MSRDWTLGKPREDVAAMEARISSALNEET